MGRASVSRIPSLVCAAFLAALPLLAAADANDVDTSVLERVLIESASTPKAHQALASYYRGKADKSLRTAELHRGMGRAYSGMKVVLMQQQKEHCKRLASLETKKAKEYTALAAGHDAEAEAKR